MLDTHLSNSEVCPTGPGKTSLQGLDVELVFVADHHDHGLCIQGRDHWDPLQSPTVVQPCSCHRCCQLDLPQDISLPITTESPGEGRGGGGGGGGRGGGEEEEKEMHITVVYI